MKPNTVISPNIAEELAARKSRTQVRKKKSPHIKQDEIQQRHRTTLDNHSDSKRNQSTVKMGAN
jgi:hypothetical protein